MSAPVGRGRAAVIPAWMKAEGAGAMGAAPAAPAAKPPNGAPGAHADAGAAPAADARRRRSRSRSNGSARRSRSRRDRSRSGSRSRRRRHRSRSRDGSSRRRRRSPSDSRERRRRRRRRRDKRKSNFDVMPEGLGGAGAPGGAGLPAGMPPLPPGMHSGSAGLPSGMPPAGLPGMPPAGASMSNPAALQQTRHARRIYVGNINNATEPDLLAFFNQIIEKAAGREFPGGAVASVYLNSERRFAFVELRTIELATACVTLDGIMYNGTSLKIKRPNDYNPTLVPPSGTSTIHLDLSKVPMAGPGAAVGQLAAQGISDRVPDGPGKIFVGGLPYELDEQALTPLLESFGKLRGLHLVREAGQTVNKGYAFCEYMDHSIMDAAIEGLNGLELAGRPLTVRRAQNQAQPQMASTAAGFGPGAGVGAPPPGIMSMGGLPGMPGSNPMAAASALASAQLPGAQSATRVLVLRDMLSKEDLENDEEFQDIEDDIRTEVSKFGNLTTLLIPRGGEPGEGRVFLEYDAPDAALAAAQQLEGRIFDNRTVKTEFMDEEKFKKREF